RVERRLVHRDVLQRVGDARMFRGGERNYAPPALEAGIVHANGAGDLEEVGEVGVQVSDACNLLTRLGLPDAEIAARPAEVHRAPELVRRDECGAESELPLLENDLARARLPCLGALDLEGPRSERD